MSRATKGMPSLQRALAARLRSYTALTKVQKKKKEFIQTYLFQGAIDSPVCER
jgi:hypothetical protein